MKLKFSPESIKRNPIQAYDSYAQNVIKAIKRNAVIDKPSFSAELKELGACLVNQNSIDLMNKKSSNFAETLVSHKANELAGIIYSFLIKLNYDNFGLREKFATNALAIAKRQKDSIHIMARANDLKELYKITARGSVKHIKILYDEKRALNDIITNYDRIKAERRTAGDLVPIDGYKTKLAAIKVEIGELLLRTNPTLAKKELMEAKEMYATYGEGKNTQKIELMLEELR